jgi:hypothetical protein
MSALGHERTLQLVGVMSALPPKADMCVALAYVCFGPIAARFIRSLVSALGLTPRAEKLRSPPERKQRAAGCCEVLS